MKMASMLDMIEFIESGDPKGYRFLRNNPNEEDSGSMMGLVSVFVLNIPTTSGLMILWLTGQETDDQSEF
tara:strand:- start:636 stop:845 length:210 start_codon:yes stop_codon:yes gene_type:complete